MEEVFDEGEIAVPDMDFGAVNVKTDYIRGRRRKPEDEEYQVGFWRNIGRYGTSISLCNRHLPP